MKLVTATKKYFSESIKELKKVTWPSKKETINNSIIVIAISLALTVFLGLLDAGFDLAIKQLIK